MRALVAVGACYLDTILTVDHYPQEDEKLRASHVSRRRGGNCPNSLEVLQQLFENGPDAAVSVPLYAVLVLPAKSSPAVREVQTSLGSKVDLRHCIYREEWRDAASSYIIRSQSAGTRTIVNYNPLPEMTADEFVQVADDLPADPTWFHFEGRIPEVTLACIQYVRRKNPGNRVSVEIEKPDRAGLRELAAEADVVFYSKNWAQWNGYQSPRELLEAEFLLTPKAAILCCTWGEGGAVGLDVDRMAYIDTPAFRDSQRPVVDTTGAGDTFIAGMLHGLLVHEDQFELAKEMRFASRLAGHKVTREGFDGLGTAAVEQL
ncbi:hypothetical protein LOZ36_001660 [Ophidiomyces ophidiicola]|nr:hypothetical protein LOZ36_001660 [Ophidiomyces ophidiicola]